MPPRRDATSTKQSHQHSQPAVSLSLFLRVRVGDDDEPHRNVRPSRCASSKRLEKKASKNLSLRRGEAQQLRPLLQPLPKRGLVAAAAGVPSFCIVLQQRKQTEPNTDPRIYKLTPPLNKKLAASEKGLRKSLKLLPSHRISLT